MPEVIDLTSYTPPKPSVWPGTQGVCQFPLRIDNTVDDIEDSFLAYDGPDKLAKRRRLTDERYSHATSPTDNVFIFSDEDDYNDNDAVPFPTTPRSKLTLPSRNVEPAPVLSVSDQPRGYLNMEAYKHNKREVITIDDEGESATERRYDVDQLDSHPVLPELNELDKLLEPLESIGQKAHSSLSSRTTDLLAHLEDLSKDIGTSGSRLGLKTSKRSRRAKDSPLDDLDEPYSEPSKPKPTKKRHKPSAAEKEEKARSRKILKAQRELERLVEKERKQKLKEEKAWQRQLAANISQVNKLKTNRKDSTSEMIVDVASTLEGSSVGDQTVEFMKRLGVECTFYTSPVPNLVKWRRKVIATFDETTGRWEPCAPYVAQEEHVLCLLTAQEFVKMAITRSDTNSLDLHVAMVKNIHPACKPIYLIEGLTSWARKNKKSRNRAYQAEVLRQMEPADIDLPEQLSRRDTSRPEATSLVDDDEIEDALLQLQVSHSCLIHHTNTTIESSEWIKNFTEHISTIPYRRERMESNDSAFCMDVGQVKAGDDKLDTFVKMLQEINRVTASMAYGITAQYPTVTDLVKGMKAHGPTMLEDVRKSANRNGALADSRIGPAVSKRLYKAFMGADPTSTDI